MKSEKISRRDFLKLIGVSPLFFPKWPYLDMDRHHLPAGVGTDERPNILIVVFDALTARHMSLYGYSRRTTPNIERAAGRATVFHRHYANGNFTTPGTASLLTGVHPWSHRGLHLYGVVDEDYKKKNLFHLFATRYNTFAYSHNALVADLFHQFNEDIHHLKGRSELCLISYSYTDRFFKKDLITARDGERVLFDFSYGSMFLSQFKKLRRYFSRIALEREYQERFPRGIPRQLPGNIFFTLEHAINWLKIQLRGQPNPFLGYVHLLPPHDPYTTRHDFIDLFEDGRQPVVKPDHFFSKSYSRSFLVEERRLYDEYIAYVDAEFGRLYEFMERTGILNHTCVVLTSDHGELFERGIYRHLTPVLYEPLIHIPLLIWVPGQDQRCDVSIPTSAVDVLPTLLYLSGQSIPEWQEGQVLPTFGRQPVNAERSIFSVEAKGNPKYAPLENVTIALIKGRYKLVHYLGYDGYQNEFELYDLENDPEELEDLYLFQSSTARTLRAELGDKLMEVNRKYL